MTRTRIAPSPTGKADLPEGTPGRATIHVGTAYQALFNHAWARKNNGQFIVRIEDTDRNRYVPEAIPMLFETLDWLGIRPDESPVVDGPNGPYVQSERVYTHRIIAEQLLERGLAYRDFTTQEELDKVREEKKQKGQVASPYDMRRVYIKWREAFFGDVEKLLDNRVPHTIRFKMPEVGYIEVEDLLRGPRYFNAREMSDPIFLKADGFPTYHLAAMCDDHEMGITHVMRAEEWLTSLPIHSQFYKAMDWQEPVWIHTPLLRGEGGRKLSKRDGDVSVLSYRDNGIIPEALANYLCTLGWRHPEGNEFFSQDDFIKLFDPQDIILGAPKFNWNKLSWYNRQYIMRHITTERLTELVEPMWARFKSSKSNKLRVAELLRTRVRNLNDFAAMSHYFFDRPKIVAMEEKHVLSGAVELLKRADGANEIEMEAQFREYAKKNGIELADVCQPVRKAISGLSGTPSLFSVIDIIGNQEAIRRIQEAG